MDGNKKRLIYNCQLSLSPDDFSETRALSFDFFRSIDTSFVTFSHVYQIENYPAHLLTKLALATDMVLECTGCISLDVAHAISSDINKIWFGFSLKKICNFLKGKKCRRSLNFLKLAILTPQLLNVYF